MSTIIFKTEDAIFEFDRKDVMECLEHRKSSYEIWELDTLIKVLANKPDQTILSSTEHQYFGFIALELFSAGKGSAFCKNCGKQYRFNQLEAFTVGPGEASFKAIKGKFGRLKSLFRKKPKPIGLSGGKGIKCPEGHTLIFMITWRT